MAQRWPPWWSGWGSPICPRKPILPQWKQARTWSLYAHVFTLFKACRRAPTCPTTPSHLHLSEKGFLEEGNEGGRRRRSSVIFIASLPNKQGVLITSEKTSTRSLCKVFLLLNLTCKYIKKLIPSLYMK